MPKDRNLLIVIADGARVRFVRPAEDNALHTIEDAGSRAARRRSAELGSDHPGAMFHSDSTAHHAAAPRHDLQALEKENFAHFVGRHLNEEATRGGFDELVLVAPPRALNAIREALGHQAAARIIGTLGKDLVKTPDHELWPHVREWVRPVHRAPM